MNIEIIIALLCNIVIPCMVGKLGKDITNLWFQRKDEADGIMAKRNTINTLTGYDTISLTIVDWIGNNVSMLLNHTDSKYFKSSMGRWI